MIVCGNGDVAAYCKDHGMIIYENYAGDPSEYRGTCAVLVTDREMPRAEYYYKKSELMARGVELVSIHHTDDEVMTEFLAYLAERRKTRYGNRQMFGYVRKNGVVLPREESLAVVRRIFELRDAGHTLRVIQDDPDVHHPDGRKLSVATIQKILKDRGKYPE